MDMALIGKFRRALAHGAATCTIALSASAWALPALVTPTITDPIAGRAYSGSIMLAARLPLDLSVSGLPAGLTATHNGSGTIAISGVPSASGSSVVSISATDATGTANLTVTVNVRRTSRMVTDVAAGNGHTCVVLRGGVRCWGHNDAGQLGDGTSVSNISTVQAIPEQRGVTAVVAGYAHSCALVSGGVMCWGANDLGQVGNNTRATQLRPVWVIYPGSNVTSLSAALDSPCAVVDGAVMCWGENRRGQLGNGITGDVMVPTTVAAIAGGATAVSTGGQHTCAVVFGGVRCWGSNWSGETGAPPGSSTLDPFQVIQTGSGVTAIALGREHSCVIASGAMKCWGRNEPYNVFTSDPAVPFNTPTPVTVLSHGTLRVAANLYRTCAVTSDATMCWGEGYEPGAARTIEGTTPPTAIALGINHRCVVINGTVECWGGNNGRLGGDDGEYRATPEVVFPTGSGVTSVSLSSRYPQGCAAVLGGVQCWGDVPYDPPHPYKEYVNAWVRVPRLTSGLGFDRVVVDSGVCASSVSETVCWGGNSVGQLGVGHTSTVSGPVNPLPPVGGPVSGLATGADRVCAISSGDLYCWGRDFVAGGFTPVPQNVSVPANEHANSVVSVGSTHYCWIASGGVRCAGDNTYGQVGPRDYFTGVVLPPVAAGSGATALLVGYNYSCAVVAGGLRCWGKFPGRAESANAVVDVFPAGSGITSLAGTAGRICMLQRGAVRCWDYNALPSDAVTLVDTDADIALASGTCMLVNGGLACWGANFRGGLGLPYANALNRVVSDIPVVGVPGNISVSGSGTVISDVQDMQCRSTCNVMYEKGSMVRLLAVPSEGFAFAGWSGSACSGIGPCTFAADSSPNVSASFVPVTPLDVTASVAAPGGRTTLDVQIVLRYLRGIRGGGLLQGLLTADSTRIDPVSVTNYLDNLAYELDVDGDGILSTNDGLLLLRYVLGFRGEKLAAGLDMPGSTRTEARDLERYIGALLR